MRVLLRMRLLQEILKCLGAGESCVLIGASSMGKSRVLRMLTDETMRRTIVSQEPPTLYVLVDFNRLHGQEDWMYYEVLLSALLWALDRRNGEDEEVAQLLEQVEHLHAEAVQRANPLLALRYLERAIMLLLDHFGGGVVFLMDEADSVVRGAPASFFRALKAIRDQHRYRVRYLVALRDEIERIRDNVGEIEPFYEHVTLHIFYVGPYSREESLEVLRGLYDRHHQPWNESQARKLVLLSGGHPGLLRELHAWISKNEHRLPKHADDLLTVDQIWQECRRLWQSLQEDERRALVKIIQEEDQGISKSVLHTLERKGILVFRGKGTPQQIGDSRIFSPIFLSFIRQLSEPKEHGIRIQGGRVWVDGREIHVTALELRFLEFLVQHAGEVCDREEILQYVYQEEYTEAADTALDSLVYRLRDKIEPDRRNPQYILTVRGRGFQWNGRVVKQPS